MGRSALREINLGSWYAPALAAFEERGIMAGYPDGTLRPGWPVGELKIVLSFAELFQGEAIPVELIEVRVRPGRLPVSWRGNPSDV
ncbi:MAG TPA: hypothetical protein DCL13_01255 [Peptococcaceae bacterium]|nr:hypothetical protein [Peptococcaceae bacterium]